MGDMKGDFQGGSMDIMTKDESDVWKRKMETVL